VTLTLAASAALVFSGNSSGGTVVARRHEPPNFHYLIGSARQVAPVWKAFHVTAQTPNDPQSTHSAVIWLINRADASRR
jgi:cytochrome oxidase Cu insertion factor (SCO1/SenC/PrrC family)